MLLNYEAEILQQTIPHNCLTVIARGLGINEQIYHQLQLYLNTRSIVFCLNFDDTSLKFFKNTLTQDSVYHEMSEGIEKRTELYKKGGIFFISEIILIGDLLSNNLEPTKISSLSIFNAHNLRKNSTVEFILDYIRLKSEHTIFRAYTDQPAYLNLDECVNILSITKVFFFPRFCDVVKSSLAFDSRLCIKKMGLGKRIHELEILSGETVKTVFREISYEDRSNHEIKDFLDDYDPSKLAHGSRIVRKILEVQGHKPRLRRLANDIKDFVFLIEILHSVDFECFFRFLENLWKFQISLKERSTWINSDSGLLLLEKALEINESSKSNLKPSESSAQLENIFEVKDLTKSFHNDSSCGFELRENYKKLNDQHQKCDLISKDDPHISSISKNKSSNTDCILKESSGVRESENLKESHLNPDSHHANTVGSNELSKPSSHESKEGIKRSEIYTNDISPPFVEHLNSVKSHLESFNQKRIKIKENTIGKLKEANAKDTPTMLMNHNLLEKNSFINIHKSGFDNVPNDENVSKDLIDIYGEAKIAKKYSIEDSNHNKGFNEGKNNHSENTEVSFRITELKCLDCRLNSSTLDPLHSSSPESLSKCSENPDNSILKSKTHIRENLKEIRKYKRLNKDIEEALVDEIEAEITLPQKLNTNLDSSKLKNLIILLKTFKESCVVITRNISIKNLLKDRLKSIGFEFGAEIPISGIIQQFTVKKKKIKHLILTQNEFNCLNTFYKNIILLNPDLGSIRRIEILQNKENKEQISAFLLIYKDSIEEHKYNNEIRNEIEVFKKLTNQFANLPINTKEFLFELDENEKQYEIYIDHRELRSKLPFYVYKHQFKLILSTLSIGDYVLGSDSVVERKAFADLILSMNSGRLFSQLQFMMMEYKKCYLLIEFPRRPCFLDYTEMRTQYNHLKKFCKYLFGFKKLRIIWSNSQNMTCIMFKEIAKRDDGVIKILQKRNPILSDILTRIPGIDAYNFSKITENLKNIRELSNCTHKTLTKLLGDEKGSAVFRFFNNSFSRFQH